MPEAPSSPTHSCSAASATSSQSDAGHGAAGLVRKADPSPLPMRGMCPVPQLQVRLRGPVYLRLLEKLGHPYVSLSCRAWRSERSPVGFAGAASCADQPPAASRCTASHWKSAVLWYACRTSSACASANCQTEAGQPLSALPRSSGCSSSPLQKCPCSRASAAQPSARSAKDIRQFPTAAFARCSAVPQGKPSG